MPMRRFKLSKKHKWLIDATIFKIPEPWVRDYSTSMLHKGTNARIETVSVLMEAVKVLTRNTVMADSANEFLDKCQKVFDCTENSK